MNPDEVTTVLGGAAVVCAGVITSGVIQPESAFHTVIIAIGTICGGVFAYFTNKENPFKK